MPPDPPFPFCTFHLSHSKVARIPPMNPIVHQHWSSNARPACWLAVGELDLPEYEPGGFAFTTGAPDCRGQPRL